MFQRYFAAIRKRGRSDGKHRSCRPPPSTTFAGSGRRLSQNQSTRREENGRQKRLHQADSHKQIVFHHGPRKIFRSPSSPTAYSRKPALGIPGFLVPVRDNEDVGRLDTLREMVAVASAPNGSEVVRLVPSGDAQLTASPATNVREIPKRSFRKMAKTPAQHRVPPPLRSLAASALCASAPVSGRTRDK